MVHLLITLGCAIAAFSLCIAILLLTGKDPIDLLGAFLAYLTGHGVQGTVRNIKVDGAVRQTLASQSVMSSLAPGPQNPVQGNHPLSL